MADLPTEDDEFGPKKMSLADPSAASTDVGNLRPLGSIDILTTETPQAKPMLGEEDISLSYRPPSGTAPMMTPEATETFGVYHPAEEEPALTDEGATDLLQRYPSFNADQRKDAELKLENYFEEQDNKKEAARMQEREYELDPKAKQKFYELPEVISASAELDDPNEMYSRHVVAKSLEEDFIHRPLMDGEYEDARNKYIGGMVGKPKVPDAEAFGILKKKAEGQKQVKETMNAATTEINKQALEEVALQKPDLGKIWTAPEGDARRPKSGAENRLTSGCKKY
jgi:hypothetical protein